MLNFELVVDVVNPEKPYFSPHRCKPGDCGYDLYVSETVTINPGEFKDVRTNIRCRMPAETWGLLLGRSSTFRKRGLLVLPGVIDNGYRGELFSAVYNTGMSAVVIKSGDRLAQLILMPLVTPPITLSRVDTDTVRGVKGFGSTGS